jgi:hypothetical protein
MKARRHAAALVGLVALLSAVVAARTLPARTTAAPTRRSYLAGFLAPAALSLVVSPAPSHAAREWVSGRSVPKPKDGDLTGTKKDPRYLRCLNNCLPSCIGGPSGVQKEKSDCLQECQDECCQTYEQCSYRAVKSE